MRLGTNYALYIYKDEWTLRKVTTLGLQNSEIASGKTSVLNALTQTGARVEFNRSLLETGFKNVRSAAQ